MYMYTYSDNQSSAVHIQVYIHVHACMYVYTPPPPSPLPPPLPSPPTWGSGSPDAEGHLVHPPHDVLPGLVHLVEHLGLVGQLPLDVRGTEDALQVQPVALTGQPFILQGRRESFFLPFCEEEEKNMTNIVNL